MTTEGTLDSLPLDLADGLVLRLGAPEDAEGVIDFHRRVFDDSVSDFTLALASGTHPWQPDWTIVEDPRAKRIVSTVCLISQTWAYGGIAFGVGRPESVATDPEYRQRGLVRQQFEVIHEMSLARGQMMLAITGIPWFYRQLGYEMALNLSGGRTIRLPLSEQASAEPACTLRPARGAEDCAYIRDMYDRVIARELFAGVRSEQEWAVFLRDCTEESETDFGGWSVIEACGRQIGYMRHGLPSDGRITVSQLELMPEVSPLEVVPRLLRHLIDYAQGLAREGEDGAVREIRLDLGEDHRLYAVLDPARVQVDEPYAWYIRIPDLIAFLRHITPVLERNLKGSMAQGYSGKLRLSFYSSGIVLSFKNGCISNIAAIDDWPPATEEIDARFPDLTFLQLLCGRRRFAELSHVLVDCGGNHESQVLLDSLFPAFSGQVWFM